MSIKKNILWLLILSLAGASLGAALVTADDAALAARNWLRHSPDGRGGDATLKQVSLYGNGILQPLSGTGQVPSGALLYLVEFEQGQYAVVAADNDCAPVLAYSTEAGDPASGYPPAFYYWLDIYSEMVAKTMADGTSDPANRQMWSDLLAGNDPLPSRTDRAVSPLIATMWNQDWPYNELCPVDNAGPGGHVYAGCVATAMAMVMKYWNHPNTGVGGNTYYAPGYGYQSANFGSTTYHWDQMPNAVSGSNLPVATLMYHCGVAVNMNYAPDGSGAQSTDAADAFNDHFRYPDAEIVNRDSYSLTNWNNLMKAQIDNGSPMYYSGAGTGGGHAFVLDGYDAANYFHFNFGWSGSSNGYFYVNDLNGFNSWQSAIINSIPENYSIGTIMVRMKGNTATVGQSFPITVTTNPILGSWNVNHFEFRLLYDNLNVRFDGIDLNGCISSGGTATWTETEPGLIDVVWNAPAGTTLSGGGNLIKLNFTPQDAGEYLFDIGNMKYNSSNVNNTLYIMVTAQAPVATLAASQITMLNVMHLGYQEIGTTEVRTSYLLPSWDVSHYHYDLAYDPQKLEYVGIETQGTLSDGNPPEVVLNSPGSLSISNDYPEGLIGSGTLVKLNFRAIGNGPNLTVTQVVPSNFFYNATQITALSPANFILSAVTENDDQLQPPIPSLAVWPNPIRTQASLKTINGANLNTTVKVFNLRGQLVRGLTLEPGAEYRWDLKDANGERLASGIYYISWRQGKFEGSNRILIVK
jgi:hypothetical protein